MGNFAAESAESMSSSLLGRIQAYDPAGWRRFVQLYGPLVFHWCSQAGLQEADAADVVQEVFRAVAAAIDRYQRQASGSFRGWLRVVTRSKLADFFRQQQKQPESVGGSEYYSLLASLAEPDVDQPAPPDELSEDALLVRRALELVREDVEPRTWQAFWRTVIESETTAEVAESLGMSATAVRIAKSRVLRRLRQLLNDR